MAFTHAITSKKLIFPLAIAYLESHLILRHESGLLLVFFIMGNLFVCNLIVKYQTFKFSRSMDLSTKALCIRKVCYFQSQSISRISCPPPPFPKRLP